MSVPLKQSKLSLLDPSIAVPEYDRDAGQFQIVHLGVGGFHRAHLARYVDQLRRDGDTRWRLIGVGVLEQDCALRDALAQQDALYTLVTVEPDGSEQAHVVGALSRYLFAPDDPDAVVTALAAPETRIVSLTITEGGYEVDRAGRFSPRSELVLQDLEAPAGSTPRSALGMLVAALDRRRNAGAGAVTVMSCDNLPHNGVVARSAVRGFAQRRVPDLVPWLDEHTTFPSSMVDRITPQTTDRTRTELSRRFGIDDAWPVRAESFVQWVLEDRFAAGRPPFESVGVQVVEDVDPHERMKLRLLNASHQVLGHLGLIAGHAMVHEAMQDADISAFVGSYMRYEAIPTLGTVSGVDLDVYCRALEERFASEALQDTLARQVVDASDRLATFLIPVIRDRLDAGEGVEHSALVLAAWCYLLEHSASLPDPLHGQLLEAAHAEGDCPGAFLQVPEVYGDLTGSPALHTAFARARKLLANAGLRSALRSISLTSL